MGAKMIDRGKLVILLMFTVGVSAAAFSWSFRLQRGDRVLEFWGSEAAIVIRDAPLVELLRLHRHDPNGNETEGELLHIDLQPYGVVQRVDISQTPGMLNARQALLEDTSFSWDEPRNSEPNVWEYALRFADGKRRVTLVLDARCARAQFLEQRRTVSLGSMAAGMQTFIGGQFAAPGAATPAPKTPSD